MHDFQDNLRFQHEAVRVSTLFLFSFPFFPYPYLLQSLPFQWCVSVAPIRGCIMPSCKTRSHLSSAYGKMGSQYDVKCSCVADRREVRVSSPIFTVSANYRAPFRRRELLLQICGTDEAYYYVRLQTPLGPSPSRQTSTAHDRPIHLAGSRYLPGSGLD
jgi:hypothetical protein